MLVTRREISLVVEEINRLEIMALQIKSVEKIQAIP